MKKLDKILFIISAIICPIIINGLVIFMFLELKMNQKMHIILKDIITVTIFIQIFTFGIDLILWKETKGKK